MSKKRKQLLIMFLLLVLAVGFMPARTCRAASAEVLISADATDVTVGDRFFVYITINSKNTFGDFEANLTYDDSILKYVGGASVITGGDGYLKISQSGVVEGDTSRKYTLEFEALKVGLCTVDFDDRAVVYDFESGYEMSVSSNLLTLNVKAPVTASTNANLKSLQISPSQLTPAFETDVHEYSTSVTSDTEQLIITALPEDTKAIVSITGNDLLKEGKNKVIVSVLAESGNVIEYTININKETAAATVTGAPTGTPEASQSTFEFVNENGIIYAVYNGRYTILEPDSTVVIPDGYQKGSLTLSGVTVTAYLPTVDEQSEFILLYAKNDMGDTGLYQYDRIEKTLQRYVSDSVIINNNTTSVEEENALTAQYHSNMTKAVIVIAILAALSAFMTIVAIRLFLKSKGRKNDELD